MFWWDYEQCSHRKRISSLRQGDFKESPKLDDSLSAAKVAEVYEQVRNFFVRNKSKPKRFYNKIIKRFSFINFRLK